ncbi:MAG: pyruvate, phosphate dikinase [Candidatus Heimdallarchaeota archaeon]|nr:MAG: pyruvate, phosphate dikinase [Candidatus Heimdallarchaeota archaeon]
MAKKYVYSFEEGKTEMKNLLGGKGANLADMTSMGVPVPPGFIITTETCIDYLGNNSTFPKGTMDQVKKALTDLEEKMGKKLGDHIDPLLVSVRSGARVSMPGMMDTVLNLGLNDMAVIGLAKIAEDERFAYDSYRRFIMMFSDVVKYQERKKFDELLDKLKEESGVKDDINLSTANLKKLVLQYKKLYKELLGEEFPQDPMVQLEDSLHAVFSSWNNERAINYRNHEGIPHDYGTAINIQVMVYGNLGQTSATGVAFTRNPSDGKKERFGEYLIQAQGEDVVAGIRTPTPITQLKKDMPEMYKQFDELCEKLEKHYKDVQDVEFTIQQGKFYMLQTRTGKRTGVAAAKIAYDLVKEGMIDKRTAVSRVTPRDVENTLFPQIVWKNPKQKTVMIDGKEVQAVSIAKGLPASPGAAAGIAMFSADKAKAAADEGNPVILVSEETTPEDFHGMAASEGIITARGGMTSHAAVVSRQIGTTCIAGAGDVSGMHIFGLSLIGTNDIEVKEGEWMTLDGSEAIAYKGKLPLKQSDLSDQMKTILKWADEIAKKEGKGFHVRTNADKPDQTKVAFDFGALGIGLTRTEHMFMEKDRLPIVQKMILARDKPEERRKHVFDLLPFQRGDFEGIFREAKGLPVIIRLIDPPLHEFLPDEIELLEKIWKEKLPVDSEEAKLLRSVKNTAESNPMMGFRGVRLCLGIPELIEMQSRAILEAASNVKKEGKDVFPEIMVPVVGFAKEFELAKDIILKTKDAIEKESGVKLDKFKVGTMIEVPRACFVAKEIAEAGAKFLSFGTNDLTQMSMGFSRDDAGKFIGLYIDLGILDEDPFVSIEQKGVGQLMEMAVHGSKSGNKDIEIGVCGEHGGDPKSIDFCYRIGLDYVSCSPLRVPVARLAAAHAVLNNGPRK